MADESADDRPSDHDNAEEAQKGIVRKAAALAKDAATGAAGFVSDRRFGRTPAGRARQAVEDGATTFHIRLGLDEITYAAGSGANRASEPEVADAIGQIEAEGWRLDHIEYLTENETWERTDADGSVTRGQTPHTFAVLLFRRAQSERSPDQP